ncbi:MAG: FAD-dependent oxidoreductase [Flavobacteriaceae bacterium]|nr:FAD-dependent oxidoreductase [Flavobacteriaceae bacterium]
MVEESVDILVIGAGPSGCVSASYLINNNINVKIVEKSKFPRYVIGESLLPRCMDHFEEVGLLDCLKSQNYEKKYGARFLKKDKICNFDFSKKYSEGWDWTWQVPRSHFDNVLAEETQKKGVIIDFENEVVGVVFDGSKSKTTVKDSNGNIKYIHAKYIIDASGYGRVLPRLQNLIKPSKLPKHSSIFTIVKDINRPKGNEGTLITFDVVEEEIWLWVIPFSDGTTSIGFVGPTEFINSYKGSSTEMLSEMLKLSDYFQERFKDSPHLFEPKIIQNFSTAVKQIYGDGYILTGNSGEFLDPIFSSGVTFATETGLLAAKVAARIIKGENVDLEKEYVKPVQHGVDVFTSYVNEWYSGNLQKLFFHQPENPEVKKQICSVLAGYVWDETNPFVKKHARIVSSVAHVIDMEMESQKEKES